jgi:outer membrane protein assembly factor BamD
VASSGVRVALALSIGYHQSMMFRASWVFLSLTAALWVSACSSSKTVEEDPAAIYEDAESEIKGDRYQLAIEKLRMLKSKFPYSRYAAEAQLRIADVYYLQELFQEAALAYEAFRDLHPKHEKASYALFRIGEAYQADMPGNVARDLSSGKRAVEAYEDFLKQYPKDERVPNAKEQLGVVRTRLAQKELAIGNFYFRESQYDSAKGRYEKILKSYPETDSATEAQDKLKIAEERLKE